MANLGKFIHSKTGNVMSSIILGIGLATLFRKICNNGKCVIYKGPPIDEIVGKVFEYNDKCYSFIPVPVMCDNSKQIIHFA